MAITDTPIPEQSIQLEPNTQVPNDQPIVLDSNTNTYQLDPSYVPSRTFKTAYAVQDTPAQIPTEIVANAIASGQEDQLRDQSASILNKDVAQRKQDAAITLAQKEGPITQDDVNFLNQHPAFNTYFDPKNVFEVNYANKYVKELDRFSAQAGDTNAWSILKQFASDDPNNPYDGIKQFGTKNMAWHEFILNRLQNTQSKINNQSTGAAIWDWVKIAFPLFNPYFELKMRSNVPGVNFFDGFLGTNLENQRQALLNMPLNQGFKTFDDIMTNLERTNPQAAAAFGAAMLGQTSNEKVLNNLNTIGTLSDIPAVIKIGAIPYRGISVLNQARKAVRDINLANAVSPESTRESILASVGDIHGAAVSQASNNVNNIIKGSTNPTADALDALPRYMRADIKNIEQDPGSLTQTEVNILTEQYRAQETKILSTLADILRPTRIPLENATPEVMQAIRESAFSRYPGTSNSLIKIADPTLEPISNTYHVTAWEGKSLGEFFLSEDEAIQRAINRGYAVKYSEDQLANLKVRIDDLKTEIRESSIMEADTSGVNHYFDMEKQLKELQDEYKAAKTRTTGVEIKQQGNGYYIEITKPLNETDSVIRDFIYDPERISSVASDSKTFFKFLGVDIPGVDKLPFFHYVRTPEDTLSAEHNAMRKSAVYPQARLLQIARDEWQLIKGTGNKIFNKEEAEAFRRTLTYAQDAIDPNTGLKGYYFETPKQLQDFYLRTFGRTPTFQEQQAYFAVKRWSEYDLVLRETALYRYKSRLGAETHQVITYDSSGNQLRSAAFDGVVRSKFPGKIGNILIMGDTKDSSQVRSLSKIWRSYSELKSYIKGIQDGTYKLIEPYDAKEFPFKDFVTDGDKTVDYVLARNVETSPLTFKQLPQRGGGHFAYEYDHYLKQAKIAREEVDGVKNYRYEGDTTVAGVPYRAMGEGLAAKMNEVRELIKANQLERAKALTVKHLPYEWDELVRKFKTGVFDLEEPFQVVPRNRSIIDLDTKLDQKYGGNRFIDDSHRGLARNFQVQYTGKRDAEEFSSIAQEGTQTDPVYKFRPAEKVDPLQVMNRALGSIIHSTFMDDYKTYAVETWLREAAPHFKTSFATESQLRSSPFLYYKTATKDAFRPGTPPEVTQALLSNKFKIEQLVGTPSVWETFVHSVMQDLADSVASQGGTKLAERLTPTWAINKLRDPAAFLRQITFDAYLGFGYIPQIFVQMASYVNMFAITPRYATTGSFGAYLHLLSRVNNNPEILNALDKLAVKMGSVMPGLPKWRPGEWKEAMAALDRTGFSNVGSEYGPIANLKYAKPVQSQGQTFLNWGRKPFQMGESATRTGAWYIAFKEYRDANPTGAISRADLQKIVHRADLLYGNMSNASNSILHSGVLSLPTQFFAYQIRQAELFWGKRLGNTLAERNAARARMIGLNTLMFGSPMGFGVTGLPIAEYLRKEMLDNGFFGLTEPYNVNQAQDTGNTSDWIEHLVMEGLPATLLSIYTGNNYNIGPRYGSQGFTQLRDALMGDSGFLKTMAGASGSVVGNTAANLGGPFMVMSNMINKDVEYFPPTMDDFVDIFKEIQTVNKLWGLKTALETGRWVNKNQQYVMDVSKWNAIAMTVFGLQPQEQVDIRTITENLKDQREHEKLFSQRFTREWNRGLIAAANNDPEQAKRFWARAKAWSIAGGLDEAKISQMLASAAKNNTSLINRVAWERYISNAPQDKRSAYDKAFSEIHKYLQNRGQ